MTIWRCPIARILIPVDRSPESLETVALLSHLLKAPKLREGVEDVTLLYVLKMEMHPEYRVTKAKKVLETEAFKKVKNLFIKNEIEPLFDSAEKSITKTGFVKGRVGRKLREGHVAEQITNEVLEGGHDTVFLKGGKHEFKEKLLATVTDTVVHSIRGVNIYVGGIKPRTRDVFSKILIPVDGSKPSQKAVKHVAALARALKGEVRKITILHVATPGADPAVVFKEARRILERQGIREDVVEEKLREGDTAEQIIAESEKHRAVAMGKRGLTKLQDIFLGSTSRKVLHSIEDRILILVS